MSRNFDLLNLLELEFRSANDPREARPRVVTANHNFLHDPPSENLLQLAQMVFLSGSTTTPHVVVVAGVDEENDASQIALGLGRALSLRSDLTVCLVDGDPRARRLSKAFDIPRGSTSSEGHRVQCAPRLWIADTNVLAPADDVIQPPLEFLKRTIADLRNTFDFVLIYAPGINAQGCTTKLAQLADATILVLEASITRMQAARRAKEMLESVNVRLLGTVLSNRKYPIPELLYRRL